ncbi:MULTISPECIES: hypothetical protein [Actinoplanes]|uniref:hypothetical protein n=1 Tax=Actinoplanes TaxID=1865 RepID=UPI0005F2C050|nr:MULTISPECIES: hypothetical protein [Actinoplanes]GLY02052.1 hypothetical protein Acsp01_24310 [Actinoplanes sp. NBRC 101535]
MSAADSLRAGRSLLLAVGPLVLPAGPTGRSVARPGGATTTETGPGAVARAGTAVRAGTTAGPKAQVVPGARTGRRTW